MEAAGIAVCNTVTASDADLVSWARDGDDAAFEELFRRYRPRVAAFVNGIVRDEGRAEDVTQEAFLSALRRLRETDRDIVFKPWIFQIARNASIDIAGGLPAADVARLPGHPAPDSSLIDKERFDHLKGALAELSESHHRIIVLRELEGLSYREIAQRMKLSPAAVESTLFRARRKLEHEYVQIDTGRRCQSVAALIGRLAEGIDSARDRRRLDRHARRCPACRRRARELGVEPVLPRRRAVSRLAALLPIPEILRRRDMLQLPDHGLGASIQHTASLPTLAGPALEPGVTAGKAAAVVAAAALVGGGGATLSGAGPVADHVARPAVTHVQSQTLVRPPRALLLDQGLGRPLPAPVEAVPSRRSDQAPAGPGPEGLPAPQEPGGGAPADPAGKTPSAAPAVPIPALETPGVADPRGAVRRPPPSAAGAAPGLTPRPVVDTLKAIDLQAVLNQATATVSRLLPPPS